MRTKPAIRSLGVWGSVTGIMTLLYKITDFWGAIPPDLITDTQTFIVATAAAFVALVGRWRAVARVKGLFRS